MSSGTLPTSRNFVDHLLKSLSTHPASFVNTAEDGNAANGPNTVPETTKRQLLSLQVLFPTDFLPALDLLDRGLVSRFIIQDDKEQAPTNLEPASANTNAQTAATSNEAIGDHNASSYAPSSSTCPQNAPLALQNANTIYYVRSAQSRPSRFTTSYDTTTSYEVRLLAWTCSCPAFAFAAFPSVHPDPPLLEHNFHEETQEKVQEGWHRSEWTFGGISMSEGVPPVCKHLLACALAERCEGMFGRFIEERTVGVEEAAGWAAGWGD